MNAAEYEGTSTAAAPDPRQVRRALLASVIGSGFEWFDFTAYVYFSKVIAEVFFSVGSPVVSMSLALATFALGFLVRPLGGVLLGIYADRVGRTRALSLVMLLMCAGTLMLGLAPGYATLGIAVQPLVGGRGGKRAARQEDVLRQLQHVVAGACHAAVFRMQLSAHQ